MAVLFLTVGNTRFEESALMGKKRCIMRNSKKLHWSRLGGAGWERCSEQCSVKGGSRARLRKETAGLRAEPKNGLPDCRVNLKKCRPNLEPVKVNSTWFRLIKVSLG